MYKTTAKFTRKMMRWIQSGRRANSTISNGK